MSHMSDDQARLLEAACRLDADSPRHGPLTERRLDARMRREANAALVKAGFGGKGRYKSFGDGVGSAFDVLKRYGIEPDEAIQAPFGKAKEEGNRSIRIAFSNPDDSFAPEEIANSVLYITWNNLRSRGRKIGDARSVECIAYLS